MKVKLCLAVAVCVLLSLASFPALAADDDVPMWVSRVRLAYTGRSSTGPDDIVGLVHVRDANNERVVDAYVTAEWQLPDGTVYRETERTTPQGVAWFSAWVGRGTYTLSVITVTKADWVYRPTLSRAVSATITAR